MRTHRGPTDGSPRAFPPRVQGLVALALLLPGITGCSTLASGRAATPATSAATHAPERSSARDTAQTAPAAADPEPTTALASERPTVTEKREQVVKTSAWTRLKNSISRTPPQAIPLPVAESESTDQVAEQGTFPTVDGRDF